ncbi:MAG TPA: hypothetical protein VII01_14195, partial [Solirubrobacteraceae bacterium]
MATSAVTGTARALFSREAANPTLTGAWSRRSPEVPPCNEISTVTVDVVEDELEEPEELDVFSATLATFVIRPFTILVDGSVTCTVSPTRASLAFEVSKGTVTTASRDVVTIAKFDTDDALDPVEAPELVPVPAVPVAPPAPLEPLGAEPLPDTPVAVFPDDGLVDGLRVFEGVVVVGVVVVGVVVVGVVVVGVVVVG